MDGVPSVGRLARYLPRLVSGSWVKGIAGWVCGPPCFAPIAHLCAPTGSPLRLAVEPLEGRALLAAGGGFTAGGILGEYFANPDLDGSPAFTRRDNRIDFDWQGRAPGGSVSPDFASVGADDFSVRWTGQVIPRFSESYTFGATGNGGVRLSIRPAGGLSTWTVLIDTWDAPDAGEATARSR